MKSVEWIDDQISGQTVLDINQNAQIPAVLENNQIIIDIKACAVSKVNQVIKNKLVSTKRSRSYEISGIVKQIGPNVSTLQSGDEVTGIVPLDSHYSGCAETILLNEFDVIRKSSNVSHTDSAATIGDAFKAYVGLHYMARLRHADKVLIVNGANSFGIIAIQLAHYWGANVIITINDQNERQYLKPVLNKIDSIIQLNKLLNNDIKYRNNDNSSQLNPFISAILEETAGLGCDIIIECTLDSDLNNVCNDLNNSQHVCPSIHDIISSLSVGGKWITNRHDLQLDPPYSTLLFMKCATIGYLFEHSWILSATQMGRYLTILTDVLEKLNDGLIRPLNYLTVSLNHLIENDSPIEDFIKTIVTVN